MKREGELYFSHPANWKTRASIGKFQLTNLSFLLHLLAGFAIPKAGKYVIPMRKENTESLLEASLPISPLLWSPLATLLGQRIIQWDCSLFSGICHSIVPGYIAILALNNTVLWGIVCTSIFLTDGKLFESRSNSLFIYVSPAPSKVPGPEQEFKNS